MTQQGDVLLQQTNDDGEIEVEGGVVTMSPGLETSAYLSLFGGNEQDDSAQDSTLGWWGNLSENEPAKRYVSETQNLLRSIPATSSNLRRIEQAALRDLEWFTAEKVASRVTVEATVPRLNTIRLTVTIEALGDEQQFEFTENWKAAA